MIDRILIVDDEFLIRQLLEETARRRGVDVVTAASGEEAMKILEKEDFQMAFVDFKLGRATGMDVLRFAVKKRPNMLFVIMTAYGTVETAIEAIKLGAFDFVIKPFSPDQMDVLIEKARLWLQMDETNRYFRKEMNGGNRPLQQQSTGNGSARIVGTSPAIQELLRLVRRVAPTDATVLVTGESGTGKELVASEINSIFDPDGSKPYIRMNCAAVPENLLESELFGHERGAFTGATERRIGRFELANGGTLLLDEIGEISAGMQAKLLRVLQESEFERVGGSKTIKVKVRVVATTNRNLKKEVSEGNFREDLYYRLNVFPVHLPPLRERSGDAASIAQFFLINQSKKLGRTLNFTKEALHLVNQYPWPGNIRELENVIERIAILEDGPDITPEAFPSDILRTVREDVSFSEPKTAKIAEANAGMQTSPIGFNLMELERMTILRALDAAGGNKTRAAELLGFSIRTLRNKLNEYKMNPATDQ